MCGEQIIFYFLMCSLYLLQINIISLTNPIITLPLLFITWFLLKWNLFLTLEKLVQPKPDQLDCSTSPVHSRLFELYCTKVNSNLWITDNLGPDNFDVLYLFLVLYKGCPLSEVKLYCNFPVGTTEHVTQSVALTPMVSTDLVGLIPSHDDAVYTGLLMLQYPDVTNTMILPFWRVFLSIKQKQFSSPTIITT